MSAALSDLTTHQTYEAFGPRLNSGQVVLLDHSDLQNQFLGLVWRGARIDHANNEHDDFAGRCSAHECASGFHDQHEGNHLDRRAHF